MGAAILVLVVVLAGSGTASATSLTSPTGTVVTPTIKAESEGYVTLDLSELPNIECESKVEGTVNSHGTGKAAEGKLSSLSFTNCKNDWHVTVSAGGALSVKWTSGYNGDVYSTGITVEATRVGVTCRYSSLATTVGTITGGKLATLDISASIPFHSGSIFCGSEAPAWTGTYLVTTPAGLYVDEELSPELGTTVTAPTGTIATPTVNAVSEGHITIDHPITNIQCQWAFNGKVESHGASKEATMPLSSVSTTGCTDSWHGTTIASGELKFDRTSGYDGKVTWSGGTVEMTRLGTTCSYKSENTQIGTITGGSPATIDVEGKLPFHSGSPLCGTEAYSLTGSFKVTSPSALFIDKEVGPVGTSLTSPTGTVSTPTLEAESEGHVVLDNPIATIDCAMVLAGKIESHGFGTPASGKVSTMSYSGCTNEWHTTVVLFGTLSVKSTSGYNGELYSNGVTIEATRFGINCRYKTSNSTIGTLTGGAPATVDIAASIPFHSGSIFCGAGATAWTGSLKVTSPSGLYVDEA